MGGASMPEGNPVRFGLQVAPVSPDLPDHLSYREAVDDCLLAEELGYHGVWFLEHHFTDYYPTPSPLLFMSHVARACPKLSLGPSVLEIGTASCRERVCQYVWIMVV